MVAMVLERVTARSASTIVVDRLGAYGASDLEAPDAPVESPNSGGTQSIDS
jgi:hypothetical protein